MKLWAASQSHFVEDEAYYRLWGLNPALGYFDHPPMIGWWIWAGQQLFGDTVLGVRFFVVLSSVVGSFFLWRTAVLLFDEQTAGWAVLFLNASVLVGVGGILATPDAPSVLFWGLALWALAELVNSENPIWWLAVGLFAGLGVVSKYSVLFLGAGIVLWILWVPRSRRYFLSWQLWLGGAIAVAVMLPVIYWNYLHEWASFYKQFGRAGSGALTLKYILEFFGGLIGLLNPIIGMLAVFGFWKMLQGLRAQKPVEALLLLTILPFLIYLTYHSLHARVQANWPAPLFPTFALLAAAFVAGASRDIWRKAGAIGVSLGLAIALLVQIHAVYPLTGAPGRKDPTSQLRGWPEIGRTLDRIARDTGASYVLTSGYGLNGQVAFLLKDSLPTYQFNERIRYVMAEQPERGGFENTGLYVAEERRDRSDSLKGRYRSVVEIARVPRTVRGIELEKLIVYEVNGLRGEPLDPVVTKPRK
nr:glycosyltransferase family 39 protein [Roseibium hamelinense]